MDIARAQLDHACRFNEFRDALQGFANAWGTAMPALQDLAESGAEGIGVSVFSQGADSADGAASLWDDDQTAAFYETLPDVLAFVPHLAADATATTVAEVTAEHDPDWTDAQTGPELQAAAADTTLFKKEAGGEDAPRESTAANDTDQVDADAASLQDTSDPNYPALKRMFEQLATCNSATQADDIAVSFCFIQSKGACPTHVQGGHGDVESLPATAVDKLASFRDAVHAQSLLVIHSRLCLPASAKICSALQASARVSRAAWLR